MAGQDFDGYAIDIIYMPLSFRCGCDYTMLTTDTAVSPGKPQFFSFYDTACEMYCPPCGGYGPAGGRGRRGLFCPVMSRTEAEKSRDAWVILSILLKIPLGFIIFLCNSPINRL